jgi:two-component system OmpR family sensor kinase
MGRLDWEFFGFIVLAQLLGICAIDSSIWLRDLNDDKTVKLSHSPPAGFMMTSVKATLVHGGPAAMHSLMAAMQHDRFTVFAVDENDNELLGRPVPADLLKQVRALSAAS